MQQGEGQIHISLSMAHKFPSSNVPHPVPRSSHPALSYSQSSFFKLQYLDPSFFIIGERKSATSSLYRYLIEHPQVLPCRVKEPQFFSKPWWYRKLFISRYVALFPAATDKEAHLNWMDINDRGEIITEDLTFTRPPHMEVITGEASANTFAQVPPKRLQKAYPNAKLILCLRHPVDRAYSHYQMLRRFAEQGRRVPIQFRDFEQDFRTDFEMGSKSRKGYFASISLYSDRLKEWLHVFGEDQIFIIRTEDLQQQHSAQMVMSALCLFLGLPDFNFSNVLIHVVNKSSESTLNPALRSTLFGYYNADIAALEKITGRNFNWHP